MQPTIPMWVKLKTLYKANAMSLNVYTYMDHEAVKCV